MPRQKPSRLRRAKPSTKSNRSITTPGFEEEKNRLFRKIKRQLERPHVDSSISSIHDKIERYNMIRNQEEKIIPGIERDPLKVFPPEIWREILHECARTYDDSLIEWDITDFVPYIRFHEYEDHPIRWNIGEMTKLTNVSKLWQSTIMSTPSFWSNIHIDDLTEDLEAKVVLCFQLSQDLPLRIGLQIPTPRWETLGPLIKTQSSRIRSIFLYGNDESHLDLDRNVEFTLDYFDNLPSLQELIAKFGFGYTLDLPSFFERSIDKDSSATSISITRLHGLRITPQILKQQILSGLQHVYTGFVYLIDEIPSDLFDLQHLRRFSVDETDFRFDAEVPVTPAPEHLRHWRPIRRELGSLIILKDDYHHLWGTFKSLWLKIEWDMLDRLFVTCAEMRNLETLSLNVYGPQNHILTFPTENPWYIKTLTLDIYFPHNRDDASLGNETFYRLFEALKILTPDVEALAIKNMNSKENAIPYISSLKRLKKLRYLSPNAEWPQDIGVATLPLVEYVSIDSSDLNVFSCLDCPSTLALSFKCYGNAIQKLNANQWKSIQSLDVRTPYLDWTDLSLPLVKTIAFTYERW